jgi:site-specific recombinase XerD
MRAATMKKITDYARLFFTWIRSENYLRYKTISQSWIETIEPGRSKSLRSEFKEHEYWELEQVRKVAQLQPANLTEERDQAAVCFLFLSAMRAQAFVSLPVEAVDLRRFKVNQFPELGVHTKNSKAAQTGMLQLPDLLDVVTAWDQKIRATGCALWFPRIDRWHRFIGAERVLHWPTRSNLLAKGIRRLCERAGVPYLSPHKLRHGHAVFMMRRVKDMHALKVLSQNLMHESVATTDSIYARLVRDDIEDLYGSVRE